MLLDERFRTLMKTGQFNVLQIKPVPVDGHLLRLDISAQEAKSREFGFWGGFDTYEGALAGVQIGDRDLFGYGRPLTATIEVSQRSYRGEILYQDPFFFDTDFVFTARAFALTFDYDGYTKFELGGRFELRPQDHQIRRGLADFCGASRGHHRFADKTELSSWTRRVSGKYHRSH